jgi:peptidoglycan/LPS O-acetylase OafA/YrhL
MQSWRWANPAWLQSVNVLLVVLPASILFAWVFFWLCERPFMIRKKKETTERRSHWTPIVESQPSTVSD